MKGVIFSAVGAAPEVVDSLTKPEPADDQVLVKSLWTAISPVDSFMSSSGILVLEWPLVLGVDAGGVVVSAGSIAESKYKLTAGSYVFGCTRLGSTSYSTCQEFYLMDAAVTVPKPSNITVAQSATLGVATYTASLGLFAGLNIPVPDPSNLPAQTDEWIIVLGGSSSVGKAAIQIALACGYKVLTSCSKNSKATIDALGAETFDYKMTLEEQAKAVMDITGGKFSRVMDAVAEMDPNLAKLLFKGIDGEKYFATTNDWAGITDFEGGKTYLIRLGEVGRPNATELNGLIAKYVPLIAGLVESEKVVPSAMEVIGGEEGGFESAVEAYKFQMSGKGGSKKVVVKIGSE